MPRKKRALRRDVRKIEYKSARAQGRWPFGAWRWARRAARAEVR